MLIAETPTFSRQVGWLLDPESYRLLQNELMTDPEKGAVIPGTGGLRKLRWPGGGHGKRGGVRVIYYWAPARQTILTLLLYPKSEQDDLTWEQRKVLRRLIEEEFE